MLVKLVDKKTHVATIIPIADDSQIEFGEGLVKYDEDIKRIKICSVQEDVLCLPDKVYSEMREDDLVKFFAEYKDTECISEIGIEAYGPMIKSIAFNAKEYDGYILENGKTVDRI